MLCCVIVIFACSIVESQGQAAGCWAEERRCDAVQLGTRTYICVRASACVCPHVCLCECVQACKYIFVQTCEVKKEHPVPAGMFNEAVEGEGLRMVIG